MRSLSLNSVAAATPAVTLNLFQGPSIRSISVCAAQWMLKQVQHDEVVWKMSK